MSSTRRIGIRVVLALLLTVLLSVLLSVGAWSGASASAQESLPGATFSERVDVDLVQLEVSVSDEEGRPVTGLGRDDFQVRYGGKKVDLSLFSAVQLGVAVERESSEETTTAEQPAFVVLLVDHDHLDGGLSDESLAAVGLFVAGLGEAGRAMVLSGHGDDLNVVQPFTGDAAAVTGALRELDLRPSPTTAAMEYGRLLAEIRREAERPVADDQSRGLSSDEMPTAIRAQVEGLSQKVYRELAALTLRVDRAITGMAGLPGRKELVLVTGSLPSRVVHDLNLAWNKAFGPGSNFAARPSLAESTGGVGRFDNQAAKIGIQTANTEELFDIMARRANAQGVTLHVLGAVASTDGETRVDDPALMAALANRTGGRAVIGQNAHRVLESVSEDLRSYYVLAFTPPKESKSDAAEPGQSAALAADPVDIEVKLGREHKKLSVSHRASVRVVSLEERAMLSAVSALLLGAQSEAVANDAGVGQGPGLGLRADTPTQVEGRDDVLRLPVVVLIPLRHLTLVEAESGIHQGRASLFFTTGDLAGGAGPVQKVQVPLQLTPEQLEGLGDRQIEYTIDVPMGLDAQRVAVALRDDLSGDILAASTEIQRLRLTP